MFKRLFLGLLVVVFAPLMANAQYWKPSADADHHNSVVKISGDGYSGSGSVIKYLKKSEKEGYYIGLILTAAHVIYSKDTRFEVYFNNGAITNGGVVVELPADHSYDPYCDYGIIRALIPDSVTPLRVSTEDVPEGSEVELCGFGRGGFKHWLGEYAGDLMSGDGHIVFGWAVQGDSGGPILYKGKIIGVICFGTATKKFEDTPRAIVAPIYGTCVSRIKKSILETL